MFILIRLNHLLHKNSILTFIQYMLICMCMLNKRTQILFDKELWQILVDLAKAKKTSVGELVRAAVREKYEEEKLLNKRKEAVEAIIAFRKKYGKKLAKGEDSVTIIRRMRDIRYGS